jgi:hypothetical protein
MLFMKLIYKRGLAFTFQKKNVSMIWFFNISEVSKIETSSNHTQVFLETL